MIIMANNTQRAEGSEITQIAGNYNNFSLNQQPIVFYEEDLKELVLIFSETIADIAAYPGEALPRGADIEVKNERNNLSDENFRHIMEFSLPYFHKIEIFLKDVKNIEYYRKYNMTVFELQTRILAAAKEYKISDIFISCFDYIVARHRDTIGPKRNLVLVFLHYMYWSCDIGRT